MQAQESSNAPGREPADGAHPPCTSTYRPRLPATAGRADLSDRPGSTLYLYGGVERELLHALLGRQEALLEPLEAELLRSSAQRGVSPFFLEERASEALGGDQHARRERRGSGLARPADTLGSRPRCRPVLAGPSDGLPQDGGALLQGPAAVISKERPVRAPAGHGRRPPEKALPSRARRASQAPSFL